MNIKPSMMLTAIAAIFAAGVARSGGFVTYEEFGLF